MVAAQRLSLVGRAAPRLCPSCPSQAELTRLTAHGPLCALLRRALRDALRRLLSLFGEMLKVAIALKSRISERVGLCLEDEDPPGAWPSGQALSAGECPDGPASEPWGQSAPCCPPPSLLCGAGPDELPKLEVGQCLWDTGVLVL